MCLIVRLIGELWLSVKNTEQTVLISSQIQVSVCVWGRADFLMTWLVLLEQLNFT